MKIAFITGCLEPGRDGVGDYTRLLAKECVRRGHQCCLVALSDRYVVQTDYLSTNSQEVAEISTLRLSANIPWEQRAKYAQEFLAIADPDWVSLQFVPYGYQNKGIVAGLSKWLRQIVQGRLHIMFHELWIGQNIGAPIKEKLVGSMQRFFISRLIKELQPAVVHTSNLAYVAILQQLGIAAKCLPLFSNIPISPKNADDWLLPQLQKIGLDIYPINRDEFWLFGIFGTIHPVWSAEPLFTYLNQAGAKNNRKIVILSIGRLGSGKCIWKQLSQTYCHQFSFLQLDEQPPNKVSEFFNSIDFGISTSPYLLVGKSGTTTTMLEHGLPVIVNRDDFQLALRPSSSYNEPLLYKMDEHLADYLTYKLQRKPPHSRLQDIATNFIKELTKATNSNREDTTKLAGSFNV